MCVCVLNCVICAATLAIKNFTNFNESIMYCQSNTGDVTYLCSYSNSTHQQGRGCCRCWRAAGSVASAAMAAAAAAGNWWWTGTGKGTPRGCSASFGPAEDCCGAEHGWRSSSQQRAEGALSTEWAEAGRSSEAIGWRLAAVSVSGAGVVPPQHSRDAWWCRSASPARPVTKTNDYAWADQTKTKPSQGHDENPVGMSSSLQGAVLSFFSFLVLLRLFCVHSRSASHWLVWNMAVNESTNDQMDKLTFPIFHCLISALSYDSVLV